MPTATLERTKIYQIAENLDGWEPEDEVEPTFGTIEEEREYFVSRITQDELNAIFCPR